MYLLEVADLKVKVENRIILDGVSFGLKSGEIHILFGPNGSGKTTLIGTIIGLPTYEVVSGRILFMGEDITGKSVDERAKFGIGVGFQNPPEIAGVKLGDLLKFCLGKSLEDEFSEEEMRLIEAFRLKDFLKRETHVGFSGGERKRSEILQLLFLKPKVLLLDEPDSGVDVESLKIIAGEIQRYIESSGASALIITHKGDILEYVNAKYGCVLLNGKIHCFTDPKHVYEDIKREGYEGCIKCQVKSEEKW
ncbi:MAG: ABC transporter ATP-binding protein [Candidatus Bathyarchaeota archaeon]|nr:ABC transporter ATP-binding protein [Candidatus Bathyarchaeota archaeon]MCX8177196.1 ABC transporter ATP-binding protein [Candidatus Bathyarchaeota archaeon]MDW8193561.1 ABC transporter ATP-binding protein [Nitrososphaerota archaeon]